MTRKNEKKKKIKLVDRVKALTTRQTRDPTLSISSPFLRSTLSDSLSFSLSLCLSQASQLLSLCLSFSVPLSVFISVSAYVFPGDLEILCFIGFDSIPVIDFFQCCVFSLIDVCVFDWSQGKCFFSSSESLLVSNLGIEKFRF